MKGKIDKNGWLTIERSDTERPQLCPVAAYNPDIDFSRCGDWCPLFGEPVTSTTEYITYDEKGTTNASSTPHKTCLTTLQVCNNRTLIFDEFTDERAI